MPKKPPVDEVDPREVARGMVVWSKAAKRDEVVRDISIVLHLANGYDEVYTSNEAVEVLAKQPTRATPRKHQDLSE